MKFQSGDIDRLNEVGGWIKLSGVEVSVWVRLIDRVNLIRWPKLADEVKFRLGGSCRMSQVLNEVDFY